MAIPRNVTSCGEPVKYSDDQATVFLATIIPPGGTLFVSGGLTASGPISGTGLSGKVTAIAVAQSPYTVKATDETITVDASGGAVTVNLPAATGGGRFLYIAKIDSSANGVTIQTNGGDTLNGVAGVGAILTKQFEVANIQDTAAATWISVTGDVTIQTVSAIDGTGGSNRDLDWMTVGSVRWTLRANNTAESGGNAGSDLNLIASDDTGAVIDSPITIARVAGGRITLATTRSLVYSVDNTTDIGSPDGGTTLLRPRTLYLATQIQSGFAAGAAAAIVTEQGIFRYSGQGGVASIGTAGNGAFVGTRYDGTAAVPTAVVNADDLVILRGRGYDGTAFGNAAQIRSQVTEAWAVGAHGSRLIFSPIKNTTTATIDSWIMENTGDLLPGADNTYNIGTPTTGRVKAIALALGGGTGVLTAGPADSGGSGFRLVVVPN